VNGLGATTIEIPGDELVVPWQGITFATTGEDLGQNALGSGLIGRYPKGAVG
jgi:branched-chain amino acid transport system substrate-binding protein